MLFGFLGLAIWLWWITVPLVLHLLVAAAFSAKRVQWRKAVFALFPCLYPLVLTLFGIVYRHDGNYADAPAGPIDVAGVLYLVQILLCLSIFYINRGVRWFTAAAGLLALWLGFLGFALAEMALTDRWV